MESLDCAMFLPHRDGMLLLDELIDVGQDGCTCRAALRSGGRCALLQNADGTLPSEVGIELICQCVGVYSGFRRKELGLSEITLGMVLSCRGYQARRGVFPKDAVLEIRVSELMNDGRVGSFSGSVSFSGEILAEGQVSVYQPDEAELEALFTR